MGVHPESSTRVRGALPESLARAIQWLDGRPDEPIALETLAAVAGVRPRTLEAHFKLYLGATPLGWVRRMRLARARQQLLAAGGTASVTEIALANGFSQFGRFAAQYRRQFGELPSQTVRSLRAPPPGAADARLDEARRLCWRAVAEAFMVGPDSCGARSTKPSARRSWRHRHAAQGDRRLVLEPARGAQFRRHAPTRPRTGAAARRGDGPSGTA